MQTYNTVKLAHYLLLPKLYHADCVVDATAGNGNDTLFLAANTADNAKILAFDVQQEALSATKEKLVAKGLDKKTQLILDSHENIGQYTESIDVAMFNLGYLPTGDHDLCTRPTSTINALTEVLSLLTVHGLVSVNTYSGHLVGAQEQTAVEAWLKLLPNDIYTVGLWTMINHPVHSPKLYLIEKVRSEVREGIASR